MPSTVIPEAPPANLLVPMTPVERFALRRLGSRQSLEARISWRRICKLILRSTAAKVVFSVSLFVALFGSGLYNLCNIPDEPWNDVLDAVMVIITAIFVAQLCGNSVVDYNHYPFSPSFWTDILGTVSMIFEISFLLGTAGELHATDSTVDTQVLRTARVAKVGARAARFAKLLKLVAALETKMRLPKRMKISGQTTHQHFEEAKVISRHLRSKLSMKVSLLTIAVVLLVPLFQIGQYPEQDMSMRSWAQRLEADYARAHGVLVADTGLATTDIFQRTVEEMVAFYSGAPYFPYRLRGYTAQLTINGRQVSIPGEAQVSGETPNRRQGIYMQKVPQCRLSRSNCEDGDGAAIFFDFQRPNQFEAGMDIAMIVFIVLVMVFESFDMSVLVDSMLVKPLERMLSMLYETSAKILNQVSHLEGGGFKDEVDCVISEMTTQMEFSETALLERALEKLVKVSNILMSNDVMGHEDMAGMDDESKGVFVDLMQVRCAASSWQTSTKLPQSHKGPGGRRQSIACFFDKHALSIDKSVIESWELDLLSMEVDDIHKVMLYIIFDSSIGQQTARHWIDSKTFQCFYDAVDAGYIENPYHNFTHARDVCHAVWLLLHQTRCEQWTSDVEQFALLLAGLSHDLGHDGKTNIFLLETSHQLALLYNDKSPLENMHCAKLYEICAHESSNIFKRLSNEQYKQARRVCIETILHTDNAHHFQMVKDISTAYELTSEVCDAQNDRSSQYETDVLRKNTMLWLKLFLHMADVSNSLKPFAVCKAWAWRVLEEFFAQGDEEKKLGIPVGMLNDRDKVNKPGSQHGFIAFLVAPLVYGTIKVFWPLSDRAQQMASNLEEWRVVWALEAGPSPEELAKRDADVRKIRSEVDALCRICLDGILPPQQSSSARSRAKRAW